MTRLLSVVETAKLVRAALKKNFPGVKFKVRSDSYAGGASIRVRWFNGPTTKEVEAVVGAYKGGGFDGMIDMKYYVTSYLLPDGSAVFGRSSGTEGSMGSVPGYEYEKPEGAEEVSFGADFIFCEREFTVEPVRKAVEELAEYWKTFDPASVEIVEPSEFSGAYLKDGWNINVDKDHAWSNHYSLQAQVNMKLSETSL